MAPLVSAFMLALWGGVLPRGLASPPAGGSALGTLSDREVWRVLGMSGLVQLSLDLFPLYMPIYGRSIGLPASAIGNVVGIIFVAAFVLQLALPRIVRRVGERKVLSCAFFAAAAGFLLVPLAQGALSLGLVACVFGLAMGSAHPIISMLLSSRAPKGRPAESLGLRLSVNNILRVLGPTALGSLGSAFGLVPMFVVTALMMGSGGILSRRLPLKR